jgi:hypothetical protein
MAFQRRKPAAIDVKVRFPRFIEPASLLTIAVGLGAYFTIRCLAMR